MTNSGDEAEFFAELDGVRAALGTQLVKGAAAVGLDGVFTDEEAGGDFAVAETFRDQGEDFQFAAGDAEGFATGLIQGKGDSLVWLLGWLLGRLLGWLPGWLLGCSGWSTRRDCWDRDCWDRDFKDDKPFCFALQLEAKPDAQSSEDGCDEAAVDLQRVFDDEKAVLHPLQYRDQDAADHTISKNGLFHQAAAVALWTTSSLSQ